MASDRWRQRGKEMRGRKRAIQPHLQHTDFLAARGQRFDGLARSLGAGTHQNENAFGVGRALIFEQLVVPPGQRRKAGHRAVDDSRHLGVERADRLSRLEEGVGVLRRAPDERVFGVERAGAMGADQVVRDHRPNAGIGNQVQRVEFVRGAKAVEEMQERNPCFQGRGLGDQRGVMGFLHVGR